MQRLEQNNESDRNDTTLHTHTHTHTNTHTHTQEEEEEHWEVSCQALPVQPQTASPKPQSQIPIPSPEPGPRTWTPNLDPEQPTDKRMHPNWTLERLHADARSCIPYLKTCIAFLNCIPYLKTLTALHSLTAFLTSRPHPTHTRTRTSQPKSLNPKRESGRGMTEALVLSLTEF